MRPRNQVWSCDITYIPMVRGFMYLVAILDWFSRYVLAWQLSNTLDGLFCQVALQQALKQGRPEIFNSDPGAQFTAGAFTSILESASVRISMDGRGRALDNIFVERLWRTVKYEHTFLMDYNLCLSWRQDWTATSSSTTASGCTRAWAIARRQRFTMRLECLGYGKVENPSPTTGFPLFHSPCDGGCSRLCLSR